MPGALNGSSAARPALGAMPPIPNPQNDGGASPAGPQMPQQAPAPSHGQTVAAMRHFQAILGELRGLLQDPDLGKADMRSAIIDGTTKLVAQRIIAPAQAVQQLATVPDRPYDQKQWAQQQYAQTVQAQTSVLDHHRAAALGTGNYALENELHGQDSDPSDHMADMKAMMQAHYGGQP